jgi:hypothetical protein
VLGLCNHIGAAAKRLHPKTVPAMRLHSLPATSGCVKGATPTTTEPPPPAGARARTWPLGCSAPSTDTGVPGASPNISRLAQRRIAPRTEGASSSC